MHVEPVLPNFDYVTIRRTGGIVGMDQSLHVDRDLRVKVQDRLAGERRYALDAWTSQELMTALAQLAARRPSPSTHQGCDLFHYDIELSYGGTVYRINSVDLGADEALHGVMLASSKLIDHEPDPFHVMGLHVDAHAEPVA